MYFNPDMLQYLSPALEEHNRGVLKHLEPYNQLIQEDAQYISKMTGTECNPDKFPTNDLPTLNAIRQGDTEFVPFLDTFYKWKNQDMNIRTILQFDILPQPFSLTDIKLLTVIFGGPWFLGNIDISSFWNIRPARVHGIAKIDEILAPTYGITLYREQLIRIATDIGGLGAEDAYRFSQVHGSLSCYKEDKALCQKLQEGAQQRGYDATLIEFYLSEKIDNVFSEYHAEQMTLAAYRVAYMQQHYPDYCIRRHWTTSALYLRKQTMGL